MKENEILLSSFSLKALEEVIKKCIKESMQDASPPPNDDEELLTIQEASEYLKVSQVSIHNWKREKGLKFYRIGRAIRFKKVDLMEFAKGRQNK